MDGVGAGDGGFGAGVAAEAGDAAGVLVGGGTLLLLAVVLHLRRDHLYRALVGELGSGT